MNNFIIGYAVDARRQADKAQTIKYKRRQFGHNSLAVTGGYFTGRLKKGDISQGEVDTVRLQLLVRGYYALNQWRFMLQQFFYILL